MPAKKFPKTSPMSSPIQEYLEGLYQRYRKVHDGQVATYIPELGKADPDWFGICVVMTDGTMYTVGDTEQTFTIQSISKPFTYGIALEDNSRGEVLKKIWVEPTGEAFNSISLDPQGRPLNPMINAGAIASVGMVEGRTTTQKIRRILDVLGRYAGRNLDIDQAVYRSESETGHRNRAIAHMLRNFDILTEEPTASVEAYFQQCSILVNCRDLGVMAATLANGGVNPLTGARAVVSDYIENILSVMGSCGMYDAAGEWIYNVGMPAKSGVAGGILAVLPGQLGIGVFSPRLDAHGNSVRGVEACRELSRNFRMHMFHVSRQGRSVIRRVCDGSAAGSNRLREASEQALLGEHGKKIVLLELQGDLVFASAEVVVRRAMAAVVTADHLVIDFSRVHGADVPSIRLLSELARQLLKSRRQVVLSGVGQLPMLLRVLQRELTAQLRKGLQVKPDADHALEWCENALIERLRKRRPSGRRVRLEDCELLQGLGKEELRKIRGEALARDFPAGEVILEAGDPSEELFFLVRGKASVWIRPAPQSERRVATFTPGMSFGEMALLDRAPRSAQVRADTHVECYAVPMNRLEALAGECPVIENALLRNLSKLLARRLRKANQEIGTLNQ